MKQNALLLLLLTTTAYFSVGFYHPDEHFQILELLNIKLTGITHPQIVNWDFTEKMRSWVQPGLYFLVAKLIPSDAFFLAFILRLLHSLLGFFALKKMCDHLFPEKNEQNKALVFTLCTWFVPFILVRTSSESLSASLFLLGASDFLKRKNNFTVAFLWGLSFFVRFQMGVVIAAAIAWSLLFDRRKIKDYSIMIAGFTLAFAIGLACDWWGYQETVFSVWNYFKQNFILQRAKDFGVAPFYYYFVLIFIKGVPPLSIVIMASVLIYWWKFKKDFLTSITFIFFLTHCFIAHKELRFLNFIYLVSPLMLYRLLIGVKNKKWQVPLIVLNFCLLIYLAFTPAHSPVRAYKYIADYMPDVSTFYTPLEEGKKLEFSLMFYQPHLLQTSGFALNTTNQAELNQFKNIITSKYSEKLQLEKFSSCHSQFQLFPDWSYQFNYFNWISRSSLWIIWKCQ